MDINSRKKLLNIFEREPDEKLLFSKVLNQAYLCEKNHDMCFSDFFDPYRVSRYIAAFKSLSDFNLKIGTFGGYEGCERNVIGFAPEYNDLSDKDFPISLLKIEYDSRFSKALSHRDFLGSILGLGIERTKIGDIVIEDDCAYAYVQTDIAEYIVYNLEKIGNSKVKVKICAIDEASASTKPEQETDIIVSSLRIDTLISTIFKISRSKSSEFIASDKVYINWQIVNSPSKLITEGDTITLRGKGRAKINKMLGKTKKDKFIISVLS